MNNYCKYEKMSRDDFWVQIAFFLFFFTGLCLIVYIDYAEAECRMICEETPAARLYKPSDPVVEGLINSLIQENQAESRFLDNQQIYQRKVYAERPDGTIDRRKELNLLVEQSAQEAFRRYGK